ncbi:tRNA guanosine(34) transglycosylase Tgt [Candidatus Uhrbacteria bacterium]|nr:tRNA guanosine(34) transglycosylase Tgt [Candidatus Uhrbacteria bacterium]
MIGFRIKKKSGRSAARLGVLKTPHGEVETPALVGVATQATVKTMTASQAEAAGCGMLIANTYHLHLKPGEGVVRKAGGLHRFMNWNRPMMTDSGGFQVFSLGFGMDLGQGKILRRKSDSRVTVGQQPRLLKITDDGVEFTSYMDGQRLFLGPAESVGIQESLGADIILAFDECTPPSADRKYTERSLERTHRWARVCLEKHRTDQALYGIVQGGKFHDLRRHSAETIGSMPFDGFGIGGEFGDDKRQMSRMIRWVTGVLPEDRPRHLLGIGHPDDIRRIIRAGVDTFDCTAPTHYARHGTAFVPSGRLDLNQVQYLKQFRPLDSKCSCFVCQEHTRSYISHLIRAKEVLGLTLLSFHNLHFFHALAARAREDIKRGIL